MELSVKEDVAVLRMSAGKANALGPEWFARMTKLLDEADERRARALVITGYESFFSAGLDMPSLVALSRADMDTFMARFDDLMLRLFASPRPIVAAINGHAVAGGCVLALQADVRIATDRDCKIGLNEVVLGMSLPLSVIETLRGQVPSASLMPIALEGKLFGPREALAVGLVHEVVPAASLDERAFARARELGALPPAAFADIKMLIRRPAVEVVRARGRTDNAKWLDTWFSDEGQKRIRAAVEKLKRR
jgi:enoyl-CoA hydratase